MNALALIAAALSVSQTPAQGDALIVDPLKIFQAAEVYSVIARKDNPVWPGWNASSTPLLIYQTGKQDVLINHPKPPEGFVPYKSPIRLPFSKIFIKDGPTIMQFDGQNTSTDVNGIQTLVVADTLSNRHQWAQSIVDQARSSSDDMEDQINSGMLPNAYDEMAMFCHEAFHVYQHERAPNKGGNELSLTEYPSLSVQNNVGYALEADALGEALLAKTDGEARKAAVRWLAIRQDRRKGLKQNLADYEDGTEFSEGTAKYTEYKLYQVLEGRKPAPEIWLMQGFRGYADLSKERLRLIKQMQNFMSGKTNVNNDPYGASPVRFRLYYSGLGVGALLDRMGAKWHDKIFDPKVSLTSLAEEAIHATPAELSSALDEVKKTSRYRELVAEKEKLAKDGEAHIQQVLDGFDQAPAKVVLDYSGLTKPRVGLGFTPFGILRIDDSRTVYRLLPIRGICNDMNFAEDSARPVLQDKVKMQLTYSLTGAVDAAFLDKALGEGWRTGPVQVESLKLPGMTLNKLKATVKLEGKAVVLTIQG